jgi:signal transduction histidine kinase
MTDESTPSWPTLRGERRWQLLAEASAAFETSLDYEATLDNVVRLVVPALADLCSVLVLDERGAPTYGSGAALDDEAERLLRQMGEYLRACSMAGHPVGNSLMSRELGFYELDGSTLREFAVSEQHSAILRALNPTGVIIVPLTERDQLLGVLIVAMIRRTGRKFAPQDVALAHQVGRRAALAITHARMYGSAQQAIRTRDQVVATLSHDLKNPIGTVRMAIDFALEEMLDDPAQKAVRTTLLAGRRAVDRMLRLVHDLLDVAAIEAGRFVIAPAPTDVDALVTEAIDGLQLVAHGRGVSLDRDVPRGLPRVLVDRDRIAQAFSNLIGNAVKFTPPGGHVWVKARRRGENVQFSVVDTGPGISADDLPHVFDRFWRADRGSRNGTGLGLAIAHGIVGAHGGELSATSKVGEGSEFSFTVPIAGPKTAVATVFAANEDSASVRASA